MKSSVSTLNELVVLVDGVEVRLFICSHDRE
jgi:hypothetical protein